MTTRRTLLLSVPGFAAMLPAARAQAPAFPTRTVRVFTPFPAGSGPDAALRLVAEQLSRRWGQPVVIDNRPGGNGFVAVAAFKQGAQDGHDLLQLDSNHSTTHPATYSRLPYDMQRDFAPLRMILHTPFFVAVARDSAYRTLDDLVAAARAEPGKVTYGSWFNGSPGHIGGLQLQAQKNLRMLHVPFRDFGQLYTAVSTKEVDWALASIASGAAMEQAGRIRFIAVAASQREALYPQVPATAEAPSTRGFEVNAWTGLYAPAGIAPALRDQLSADIRQALAAPDVVRSYATLGYTVPDLNALQFADLIQRETMAWAQVIKAANLKLD